MEKDLDPLFLAYPPAGELDIIGAIFAHWYFNIFSYPRSVWFPDEILSTIMGHNFASMWVVERIWQGLVYGHLCRMCSHTDIKTYTDIDLQPSSAINIYIYIFIYIYIYIYYLYLYLSIYLSVCLSVYTYLYLYRKAIQPSLIIISVDI